MPIQAGSAAVAEAIRRLDGGKGVQTMSSRSGPRDRSLTGLPRPWRIGPAETAPAERGAALQASSPLPESPVE